MKTRDWGTLPSFLSKNSHPSEINFCPQNHFRELPKETLSYHFSHIQINQKVEVGKNPFTIKVWRHSSGGENEEKPVGVFAYLTPLGFFFTPAVAQRKLFIICSLLAFVWLGFSPSLCPCLSAGVRKQTTSGTHVTKHVETCWFHSMNGATRGSH